MPGPSYADLAGAVRSLQEQVARLASPEPPDISIPTIGTAADEARLAWLERQQGRIAYHRQAHERTGSNLVRPLLFNSGTRLKRQSATNFTGGLQATLNATTKQADVSVADQGITSRMFAPTIVQQGCTADTTSASASDVDITGATLTLTPAIASAALVWATADVSGDTTGDIAVVSLMADGVAQSPRIIAAIANGASGGDRKTIGQCWALASLSAASHTVKLTVRRDSGTGTITIRQTHTKLIVMLLGPANVTGGG